ncbi:MAG: LAGLIDADG family homing endonuclease [Nanoarchaeota archaeon]
MGSSSNLIVYLKPNFQRELFQRIIDSQKGSIKAGEYLHQPASSIRAYKNLYFKGISKNLLEKIIKLKILTNKKLKNNIIKVLNKKEIIDKSLAIGRENRKKYFINLKNNLPKIEEIIKNKELLVFKWIEKYKPLLESNFRKINIKYTNNLMNIKYKNFAKKEFRDYSVQIPKIIYLNNEFLYFFGLWCGDRAGGKRFGICNKNNEIIKFTEKFLKRHYQKIEKILYITKSLKNPDIEYNKKFIIDKKIKGWVLSTHSNNGILTSFFHYLLSHLNDFLQMTENKNPFFAGLFDAEGNVSLYNKSFRWACKNQELVDTYSRFLKELDLYERYDGCCLISYNLKGFYNKIYPYMRHKDKMELTSFLCCGQGKLPENYLILANYIKNNPYQTTNNISKALKKTKVYSQLGLLKQFGFITQSGYPYKYKINNKGIKSLGI